MDKLLKLLQENARFSNERLAAMLGITEQEVADKIEEYEKKGIIKGYQVLLNYDKIQPEQVTALIELKVTPKRNLGFEEIARTIMMYEEVESVYLMAGAYDLAVMVKGKTIQEIAMFVSKKLSTLDSVLSTATHFLLRRYKDGGAVLCDDDEPVDRRSMIL